MTDEIGCSDLHCILRNNTVGTSAGCACRKEMCRTAVGREVMKRYEAMQSQLAMVKQRDAVRFELQRLGTRPYVPAQPVSPLEPFAYFAVNDGKIVAADKDGEVISHATAGGLKCDGCIYPVTLCEPSAQVPVDDCVVNDKWLQIAVMEAGIVRAAGAPPEKIIHAAIYAYLRSMRAATVPAPAGGGKS